jgi:CheY-like chemotaxis protein
LISDIEMPEADAYELIRRRDMEAGRDKFTPAIGLTAYAHAKDCARAPWVFKCTSPSR